MNANVMCNIEATRFAYTSFQTQWDLTIKKIIKLYIFMIEIVNIMLSSVHLY